MTIPATPTPTNPVLIDRVLAFIQTYLITELSWLNHSFGRSQRLVTKKDKADYYYPGVYIGKREYLNVMPDQKLGNFSFFVVDDPQQINWNPHTRNKITAPFSLIFWYDLSKIYPTEEDRHTEAIKAEILRKLTDMVLTDGGRITIEQIFDRAENIYKGFSIKEVETQFLMQPFAGIRFEGKLTCQGTCQI